MANYYGPGQRGKGSGRAKQRALSGSNMIGAAKRRRGMTLDPGQRARATKHDKYRAAHPVPSEYAAAFKSYLTAMRKANWPSG